MKQFQVHQLLLQGVPQHSLWIFHRSLPSHQWRVCGWSHMNCTADSACPAYESSQYIRCWYICFGLQFGWCWWCVNVIRTVRISCICCGQRAATHIRMAIRTFQIGIRTVRISSQIKWFGRAVLQNFVRKCPEVSRTVWIASYHTHGTKQIQRISPKSIRESDW